MTAKRIEVAGLSSARQMEAAIAARQGNVGRAEEFVRTTFGEETLGYMIRLRESTKGQIGFMLPRQIAKPDMQHASLYLMAQRLGFTIATLEWTRDFMSMEGKGYKRSYIDLAMGYIGNKGNLISSNVKVLQKIPVETPVVGGKIRICDIGIPESGVSLLKSQLAKCMCAQLAASIEGRGHTIQELHYKMRSAIEGEDQLSPDVSELGELAVLGLLRSPKYVPGMDEAVYKSDGGPTRVDKIGGQLMNVLSFTLQNVVPNLVLSVTDWNGDDEVIRHRYDCAVTFLKNNGLNEPLQFFIPPLHGAIAEPISGSLTQLDTMVPAKSGICKLARLEASDNMPRMFIDAGRSIIEGMKSVKRNGELRVHD
jgi:hypothetical protein